MAVLGHSGMDEETAAQGPAQSSSLSQAGQKGLGRKAHFPTCPPERAPGGAARWVVLLGRELTWPSLHPHVPLPYSLGLMDSRGTVMLASESSVCVGCCRGPRGSGDVLWRLVALALGELPLLLFCRSRSVSRGAGCCFSLIGGRCIER